MELNHGLFIATGLALLLLFGCSGAPKTGPPQEKLPPRPPSDIPGGKIGDADISAGEDEDLDGLLSDEELIPPLENQTKELKLDVSDVEVFEEEDFDILSEEDFVERN